MPGVLCGAAPCRPSDPSRPPASVKQYYARMNVVKQKHVFLDILSPAANATPGSNVFKQMSSCQIFCSRRQCYTGAQFVIFYKSCLEMLLNVRNKLKQIFPMFV